MAENTETKNLTAYQVAKAANKALEARQLKAIPPQMVYTYVRKGYIKSAVVNGQNMVSLQDAEAWITKYVASKLEKASEATAAEAPAEEESEEQDSESETDEQDAEASA
jgi:3-methyladenine DNA glycosylase Tag